MPGVLVDSNILIDLFTKNAEWYGWSADALADVAQIQLVFINPIIYAEISIRFTDIAVLDALLAQTVIVREPLPYEAAFVAGKIYKEYRLRGGAKTAPLPDFFIGAHAAVAGYSLLTRDPKRYRSYFPTVKLIAP